MFGRKKEVKAKQSKSRGSSLAQYGLFDIPDIDNLNSDGGCVGDDDDDDEALEAELLALTGGSKPKPPARPHRAAPLPPDQLDKLVAESLRDEDSGDDESVDENDPELLAELGELQGGSPELEPEPEDKSAIEGAFNPLENILSERLKLYVQAESNAKSAGDTSKARRFNRGIKTLNELLSTIKRGGTIDEADIPPPVSVNVQKPAPPPAPVQTQPSDPEPSPPVYSPSTPPPIPDRPSIHPMEEPVPEGPAPMEPTKTGEESKPSCDPEVLTALVERQNAYKKAAVMMKRSGDNTTALNYIKIVKQFDLVIQGAKDGQPIDLSEMPDPPNIASSASTGNSEPSVQLNETQKSSDVDAKSSDAPQITITEETPAPVSESAPSTPLEALEQRLAVYVKSEEQAKEENNSSKARRMGRIVKQYKDAIKAHKAGRSIPYDELPTPPGFPPIPGAPPPADTQGDSSKIPAPREPSRSPSPSPRPSPQPSPVPPKRSSEDAGPSEPMPKVNVRKAPGSRQEKQLAILLERQAQFKQAAIEAKKNGDLEVAKEHLRNIKGLQPLIEASNCGLPIDMSTVPLPPNAKEEIEAGFDIVSVAESLTGSDIEIFQKLQEDLKEQMKMCMRTRDHYKAVGDVGSANKFEQLALHSKKDLDVVRACEKRDTLPKFHYENRTFTILQCNTDLMDNDLEVTIVQGTNFNVAKPKDVDTYVKLEFPWPTEEPVRKKTAVIYDTNSPKYDAVFTFPIQRNVRACQRVFKRHALKCEVYSRGSFLFGLAGTDTLIGTAMVKLQPLEDKCTLHEAYDLMNGRKTVGGKLEVKIRIRNPIVNKHLEQVQEKWLVIHE
ncbi:coiled-coil and C2 domain-containing protein 1-like isoform X2 [Bemisia tabaci]|uniref:coiled-coil and C2 domain-containing protein 1-like isoform X2 n=1 Tax=Bemisia tabaci TaxID=7038 RepID=UPI003B281541